MKCPNCAPTDICTFTKKLGTCDKCLENGIEHCAMVCEKCYEQSSECDYKEKERPGPRGDRSVEVSEEEQSEENESANQDMQQNSRFADSSPPQRSQNSQQIEKMANMMNSEQVNDFFQGHPNYDNPTNSSSSNVVNAGVSFGEINQSSMNTQTDTSADSNDPTVNLSDADTDQGSSDQFSNFSNAVHYPFSSYQLSGFSGVRIDSPELIYFDGTIIILRVVISGASQGFFEYHYIELRL
ncbi:16851_t:CDS:2 [Acaulospora morrowiae]|uniref:16851_t:CDS:1 n=1 Tax=Acaulospora morrowiae TaxID=94023 RepID=A0A9N9B9U4_9GLOM|nr:16851_t:CDS:2 [Acaulospora morrowiae]